MTLPGFFDVDERPTALSAVGDSLERLSALVDFELLRAVLDAALALSDRSRGAVRRIRGADVQVAGAAGALQPVER